MPSNFQGTWQYARHSAKGSGVLKNPAAITIWDGPDDNPQTVTVTEPTGAALDLPVDDPKTTHDISFKKDATHRGRLVILSAKTPAILIGSISKGTFPLQDDDPQGPGGDNDIDVFIAVKVG